MKRKIVLDTETTGLRTEDGHRIVEIGAVEIIKNIETGMYEKTGKNYHVYINPQRSMPEEAFNVHGLSEQFLSDKPVFKDIVDDFLEFIKDSEILIHNAKFDIKFLNYELDLADKGKLWSHVKNAICTLELDKRLFSEEKKHKLDDMCKRLGVDNTNRTLHGALLDSELLADCFIKINTIHSEEDIEADLEQTNWVRPPVKRFSGVELVEVKLSIEEENSHKELLSRLATQEKVAPIFSKSTSLRPH